MAKKIDITTTVYEFDSIEDLKAEDKKLILKAIEASGNAYAPYSGFNVGAALVLENGEVFTGNNQENVAYPSGLCAERVAMFNSGAQFPNVPVKTIAITARTKKFKLDYPVAPCGGCRQSMLEYESRHKNNIKVIMMGESGKIHIVESIKSLLPLMFDEDGLKTE